MNTKQKEHLEKELKELNFKYRWSIGWAIFWFIFGLITFIIGGFLFWIAGYVCIRGARKRSKEIKDIEFKLLE
jgi:hypothetical protein